ncbi:hypothetical protein E4U21_001413 [Claviceps maximensis]|nr:hypothetical protein E4U21_001413 [Claviceps maximensis]
MNVGPPPGSHQPMLLPPQTPSELISDILSYALDALGPPTTIIIGWSKEQFLAALTQDVRQQQQQQQQSPPHHQHPLLRNPSLAQIASARHITMVFVPTVCHLRAYLATWTSPPQPAAEKRQLGVSGAAGIGVIVRPPLLMVYGLLDLHRHDGTEWSAQGLGISAAVLVEAAWRNGFRAVMLEPRKRGRHKEDDVEMDELAESLSEKVPVLSGMLDRGDAHATASWTGPAVRVAHALGERFIMGRGFPR